MRLLYGLLGALLIAGTLGTSTAADNKDVVGAWRINGTDEQGHPRTAVLYIVQGEDGKLGGRWNTRVGSVDLRDVQYVAGRLSCWWYVDTQETLIKLHLTVTVEGDGFKGQLREPHATGDVTGTRIKVKPPAAEATEAPADPDGSR